MNDHRVELDAVSNTMSQEVGNRCRIKMLHRKQKNVLSARATLQTFFFLNKKQTGEKQYKIICQLR